MDYAYTNPAIERDSNNLASQLATINYIKLARLIIFNAIEILRDIINEVESLGGVSATQTPDGVEPYTEDNALHDVCFHYGHLSSVKSLRLMIEPCFEELRLINKPITFAEDNLCLCLYPDFDKEDNLFDKLKKVYHAIYANQYEVFSDMEFKFIDNWQDIYIMVTGDIFKTLHDALKDIEMSMYIPF